MTDVHDLLARTHDALGASGPTLDAAGHDALLSGIRRRRRRRHAGEALGVAAGVVVLAAGSWFGLQRDATPQPAESPTPTRTATATVSPTPVPTPTPDAAPALAPDAPGLPTAVVLPPGTLEAATPGWVLTTVRPTYFAVDGDTDSAPTAHVLDLVSPAGERYRVLDLPQETSVEVARWVAGTGEALVTMVGGAGPAGAARLDLRTGTLTPLDGLGDASSYLGRTADGLDLWAEPTGTVQVHDGRSVVRELPQVGAPVVDSVGARLAGDGEAGTVVVDVATGSVTPVPPPASSDCHAVTWSGSQLLLTCWENGGGDNSSPRRVLRFDAGPDGLAFAGDDTGIAVAGGAGLPTGPGVDLGGGRVAVTHSQSFDCPVGWGVLDLDASTLTPVPVADGSNWYTLRTGAGSVYVESSSGCSGDMRATRLDRVDPGTGAQVELAGVPPDTDMPAGGSWWMSTTTSWVVAAAS